MKRYKQELEEFIKFVGEPPEVIGKDIFLTIMAMVYIGCGIFCFAFPNNVILVKIGLSANGWRIIAVAVSFFGGLLMLMVELFTLNKRSWNKKKKREEKQYWWWLKILFILIFPLLLLKRLIAYILREARQEVIATYIPEIFLSLLTSLILFGIIGQFILKYGIMMVEKTFYVDVTDEFIALLMVVILVASFFMTSKAVVHISIKLYIRQLKKIELKKKSKKNISGTMKREDINREISIKYEELKKEADIELKYSELYFFVIVNVILLSLHLSDDGIYTKMFINAFMGVTTLAALFREANSARLKDN